MLTLERFRLLEAELLRQGYGDTLAWSENIKPPRDSRAFANEAIFVIINSGMRYTVANIIYWRVMRALKAGTPVAEVYGHIGKVGAIQHIWANRKALFKAFRKAENKVTFCHALPWIGPVTREHLAKNLGVNTVKGDVHLQRLADVEQVTPLELCRRLAADTGYREATIDTLLWRACADGILDSRLYQSDGWEAAYRAG